jgi:phage RecT family recombinase
MMNALTIATVQTELDNLAPQIATLLPPDVPADKFRSVALAAIRNNAALLQCEPQSLFNACLNAAQDGLLPDGREGAIVPRKGKAVWQPMIQGIYKRVKTSGSVASLTANVVYFGERFDVLLGDDDRIVHRREMAKVQRGYEVAVYAIATLKDGSKEREVMTWDQVDAVRRSSAMPNSGPWTQWPDEMARKTVVRRLAKRLPVIDPADEALHRTVERVDSLYDFGKAPPDGPTIEADPSPPPSNDEAPTRAAASDMKRPPSRTEGTTARYSDDQWRAWLAKTSAAMSVLRTRQEVVEVGERDSVRDAMAAGPQWLVRDLSALLAEHYARFPEDPEPGEELPELEIAGEQNLAAG